MAIDPAQLPAAKELISKFLKEMSALLETGHKQKVYQLEVSLFDLLNLPEDQKLED
jgi:hypothetical protein